MNENKIRSRKWCKIRPKMLWNKAIETKYLLRQVNFFTGQVHQTTSRNGGWCHVVEVVCLKKKTHSFRQVDRLTVRKIHLLAVIENRVKVFDPIMIDWPIKLNPLLGGGFVLTEFAEMFSELTLAPDVGLSVHLAKQFIQLKWFRVDTHGIDTPLD